MTTDREAMQMVLEALEPSMSFAPRKIKEAINALRARLAQPDLAKVGEVGAWGEPVIDKSAAKRICTQLGWEPRREWQELTEEQRSEAIDSVPANNIGGEYYYEEVEQIAKIIEAKLKEKNHG